MGVGVLVLVVRLYDAVGLPSADRDASRAIAGAILAQAAVAVDWRDCADASSCTDAPARGAIIVRIVAAPDVAAPRSLGFTFVDARERSGTLATVFADRVYALARFARTNGTELLGRAMAHEIAHTLIGTTEHSGLGLMRAVWSTSELQRNAPSDWTLSSGERASIRRGVRARLKVPARPAAIVAANRPHTD